MSTLFIVGILAYQQIAAMLHRPYRAGVVFRPRRAHCQIGYMLSAIFSFAQNKNYLGGEVSARAKGVHTPTYPSPLSLCTFSAYTMRSSCRDS